ncbi:MAG: hypothetical protein NVS1B4_17940 [Gemmatimonadaceae bacterium]
MSYHPFVRRAGAAAGIASLVACGDYLKVTNPGPIEDFRLNSVGAIPGLVTGMSADLSYALDYTNRLQSIAGDEMAHGGSYSNEGLWYRGIIRPEDVNEEWGRMQRARWVAESGIERMKAIPGFRSDSSPLSARANLLAGYANRLLGENACQTVIENKPAQADTVHFQRADDYFTTALTIARKVGQPALATAALAGRASVRAAVGRWTDAVADAALVPDRFVYTAIFSKNSPRENNTLVGETGNDGGRREFTVFNTQWAQVFNDPRVPWDTVKTATGAIQKGQDGRTNFFRQRKYQLLSSPVPLSKGTEMLLLRAEDQLRAANVTAAFAFINQARAVYTGLAPVSDAIPLDSAWKVFEKERGADLWLEARRLRDLRRWFDDPGLAHNDFLRGRDKCIPISKNERDSNPFLRP